MHSNQLAPAAILVPLVAWRVYARMRRNIGRQRLRRGRMKAAVVIFGGLSLLIAAAVVRAPALLAALAGGLAAGAGGSIVGLRLTRFEQEGGQHFYTPNPYIGVALTLLLVGRMIYRVGLFLTTTPQALAMTSPQAFRSPLTLAIFGITAGYYVAYYAGVLRRMQHGTA